MLINISSVLLVRLLNFVFFQYLVPFINGIMAKMSGNGQCIARKLATVLRAKIMVVDYANVLLVGPSVSQVLW